MSAVPLLGDVTLPLVQRVEHHIEGGFERVRVAGLEGELIQRVSRPSHVIYVSGLIAGETGRDDLAALQKAAADGAERTFAADIATALELQKVVVTWFRAVEVAGEPDRWTYEMVLLESPPLPPPAQIEAFGGLDDFGVGDLGFDTDILGDLEDLAGDIADVAEQAMSVVNQLDALTSLGDLGAGGLIEPMNAPLQGAATAATKIADAARLLMEGLS
ncbi:hypothetical protein [Sorangium sp. So ce542]|uniref:hypothetical protein n=1 Tax=Sorangium sp. So ce542 TaxID=3133316 RepID=UPI003F6172DE